MFREMRRKKQQLPEEECKAILQEGSSGVLALAGDDDYPYAVPISYVYTDGRLYFHSALGGHKVDAVRNHEKASFCVIAQDDVLPEKYTSAYSSVIAFGRIRILSDQKEKYEAIEKLAVKYAPDDTAANREQTISRTWEAFNVMEMTIDHMTGKEGKELLAKRADK